MARPPRIDEPGRWHHVMNRGLTHRTVFENRKDRRTFLSLLARAVREGRIELHSYCLLTTHFHLLVRSIDGRLSETMRRIQNNYVRWFNRSHGRDGSLFRGRFLSRHVNTLTYRYAVVAYIDRNPVQANIVKRAERYLHGSARHYSRRLGPRWLCREWLESVVREFTGSSDYDPEAYRGFFAAGEFEQWHPVVEHRLEAGACRTDSIDGLLDATPERVLEWMRLQTKLADGSEIGARVCDSHILQAKIASRRVQAPLELREQGQRIDGWAQVEVGLLRDLCRLSLREISANTNRSESRTGRISRRHRRQLESDQEYAHACSVLAVEVLRELRSSVNPR